MAQPYLQKYTFGEVLNQALENMRTRELQQQQMAMSQADREAELQQNADQFAKAQLLNRDKLNADIGQEKARIDLEYEKLKQQKALSEANQKLSERNYNLEYNKFFNATKQEKLKDDPIIIAHLQQAKELSDQISNLGYKGEDGEFKPYSEDVLQSKKVMLDKTLYDLNKRISLLDPSKADVGLLAMPPQQATPQPVIGQAPSFFDLINGRASLLPKPPQQKKPTTSASPYEER